MGRTASHSPIPSENDRAMNKFFGIALIVAAGFGYQQWQAYQQLNDIEETDAAILSSELPIDAYLDRGFQNWLKRASFDE